MNKNILRAALGGLAILLSTCFCILTPRPALVFTPDQMPEARVGQPYHAEKYYLRERDAGWKLFHQCRGAPARAGTGHGPAAPDWQDQWHANPGRDVFVHGQRLVLRHQHLRADR